jgi:hypothetical protein
MTADYSSAVNVMRVAISASKIVLVLRTVTLGKPLAHEGPWRLTVPKALFSMVAGAGFEPATFGL